MLVGHSIEEPLDILLCTYDTRQTENLDGGIVGVNTHVHIALLARGHDSLEEVLHVGAQLSLVDAFIQIEELAELLHGSLVVLAEIAAHKALRLDDDILHQFVVLLRSHGLSQFVAFGNHATAFAPTLWELELLPFLASTWALQNIDVEISKFGIVEVEVRGTVGVVVEQVSARPVQNGHEVVADAMDALCRQVAQTLLIHLNLVVAVRTAILDGLNDWQRLYHAPAHAVALDIRLQIVNLLTCPNLTKGHIVQCGDDTFDTDLSQLCKRNLVLLAKPSPSSFHSLFVFKLFINISLFHISMIP